MGMGGGTSIGTSLDPVSNIILRGFRVPIFPPLFLGVEVFTINLGGFWMGFGLSGRGGFILSALWGEFMVRGRPDLYGEAGFRHTCPDGLM